MKGGPLSLVYEIPDHVKKAFIAIEDVRFYSHPGSILSALSGPYYMT